MSAQPRHSPAQAPERYLRARFRIVPHNLSDCGVVETGPRGESVRQSVCQADQCEEAKCHTEIQCDGAASLVTDTVTEYCICPVFRNHECAVSLEAFLDGEFVVEAATHSRSALEDIVRSLRARGAEVRLERISHTAGPGEATADILELDTSTVTDKQREAVRVAVEEGYYETPREADLGDLADRLGISRSAVSQRLTSLETKLVEQLVSAKTATGPDQ